MGVDYGEKERQFLSSLKSDTGRSLDEWMDAINAAGLAHRNDVIDWLRQQGFMFSKASWIERIHNNGGKPIYEAQATGRALRHRRQVEPRSSVQNAPALAPNRDILSPPFRLADNSQAADTPSPIPVRTSPVTPLSEQSDPDALTALLTKAKAYRPLANFVLSEVRKAVPGVHAEARGSGVHLCTPSGCFGVLLVSGKDLKLGLALRNAPAAAGFAPAGSTGKQFGQNEITHFAVLTDARQITTDLVNEVKTAASGG